MFYLIAYDIPNDKRRTKIAHLMEGYGVRVQYSVFECILPINVFNKMIEKLEKVVDKTEDSVRIYRFCETCKKNIDIKGIGEVYEIPDIIVI